MVRAPPCHGGGRGFESHPGRSKNMVVFLSHAQPRMCFFNNSLHNLDGFPSGQRGQTVNLLSSTSVVRIHPHPLYGVLAQLGEHLPYKQRVIGSSPIGPISLLARGRAVRKLVGLITRRSQVQILPPQFFLSKNKFFCFISCLGSSVGRAMD